MLQSSYRVILVLCTIYACASGASVAQGLADLGFKGMLSVSKPAAIPGSSIYVNFTIINWGPGPAPVSVGTIRLAKDNTDNRLSDPRLATFHVPRMEAQATVPMSIPVGVPAETLEGLYFVWVNLDVTSSAGQTDSHGTSEWNDRVNVPVLVTNDAGNVAGGSAIVPVVPTNSETDGPMQGLLWLAISAVFFGFGFLVARLISNRRTKETKQSEIRVRPI